MDSFQAAAGAEVSPPLSPQPPEGFLPIVSDNAKGAGTDPEIEANIRYAHSLGLQTFFNQIRDPRDLKAGPVIICGFAPSIEGELKTIRKLKKKKGTRLICVNAAHDWLLKKGIKPDIMLMLDPDVTYTRYIQRPRKGVRYFIASQCAPGVFDTLLEKGADVVVWHSYREPSNDLVMELWSDVPTSLVGGGSSTALRAINLAMVAGYADFHLFGMDSSIPEGHKSHLDYEVNDEFEHEYQRLPVWVKGREFVATSGMRSQAVGFHEMMLNFHHRFLMKTYGDGMLQHLHRHLQPQRYT